MQTHLRENANDPPWRGRVSMRSLILLRWLALAGQLAALLSASRILDLSAAFGPALLVIAAGILFNFYLSRQRARHAALSANQASFFLIFDTLQLGLLLFLTGGLTNPFIVMLLAPLTVAATILPLRRMLAVMALMLATLTVVSLHNLPLPWTLHTLPPLYVLGLWLAVAGAGMFIAFYVWRIAQESREEAAALAAARAALARERSRSALGALAAAAAHELGSPLSTIAIIAGELARDIDAQSPLHEDVQLLRQQSERCRKVLADLAQWRGNEDKGSEDKAFAPLNESRLRDALQEIIKPLAVAAPSVQWQLTMRPDNEGEEPQLHWQPEWVQGLHPLFQNAFQFARTKLEVELGWWRGAFRITLRDDGPGFAPEVLTRLGQPYFSTRTGQNGHMGLGVFIAETLLEATGAKLSFAHAAAPFGGAEIRIDWPDAKGETGPASERRRAWKLNQR